MHNFRSHKVTMGHDGMLYSLPSREIITGSIEYMANAHCADRGGFRDI